MLLVAAVAGIGCWWGLTATGAERAMFRLVMMGFANPPFFISGKGTHEAPWSLRTLSVKARIDSRKAPVVVSIGDDPGGVFQSSPPSPVDLAVVLKNLQRLGAQQAAIAAVLAWEKPDPVALKGLEIVLSDFQMVIHAAPLSRGTVRQAMPPAFRCASLAPGAIQGDLSALPIVNRVAVPDVIFGGDGALAGFTAVDDSNDGNGTLQLLARWEEDERVVLAFPLLAVLARYDLPVGGVQVKLGEFVQLGPCGPVVPIDQDGRMSLPPKPLASRADVSAEALIDGEPDIFPAAPGLIVLRDDQSTAPLATRQFSANLASAIASIGSDAGLGSPSRYGRLPGAWEVALLLSAAVLLSLISGLSRFQRQIGFGLLAAACASAQWLALGLAQVWLPGIPLLAAVLAGVSVRSLLGERPPATHAVAETPNSVLSRSPVPRAVAGPRRTFRSVTIWREPARIQEFTAAPPPGGAESPWVREEVHVGEEAVPMVEEAIPETAEAVPMVEERVPEVTEAVPMMEVVPEVEVAVSPPRNKAPKKTGPRKKRR